MEQRGVTGHRTVSGQQAGAVCQSLIGKGRQLMGPNQTGIHHTTVAGGQKENEGETEERSMQDCAIRVFKNLHHMSDKAGPEEDWTARGIKFGEAMGELMRIMESVET